MDSHGLPPSSRRIQSSQDSETQVLDVAPNLASLVVMCHSDHVCGLLTSVNITETLNYGRHCLLSEFFSISASQVPESSLAA